MSHHHSARWASGAETQPAPNVPTQFEELVYALGLEKRPDLWPHDQKIVRFVRSNRKIRYVPESLLAQLGLDGECDL